MSYKCSMPGPLSEASRCLIYLVCPSRRHKKHTANESRLEKAKQNIEHMMKQSPVCTECREGRSAPFSDLCVQCEAECAISLSTPSTPQARRTLGKEFLPRSEDILSDVGRAVVGTTSGDTGGFVVLSSPEKRGQTMAQRRDELKALNALHTRRRPSYHRQVTMVSESLVMIPPSPKTEETPALSPEQQAAHKARAAEELTLVNERLAKIRQDRRSEYRLWLQTYVDSFGFTREEAKDKLSKDEKYGSDVDSIAESEENEYQKNHPRPYGGSRLRSRSGGMHPFFEQDP